MHQTITSLFGGEVSNSVANSKDFVPSKEGSWDWEGRVAYYANTKFGVRRSHVEEEIGRLSCARTSAD